MRRKDTDHIPGGMALGEQAIHLLRRSGAAALLEYYIGSLPFALGLLYFWSDMSRNPMAYKYCAPAAAGLALLFIWMKYWQVRFCRRLICHLQGGSLEPWPWSRSLATAARQCALQATGVLVLPLAMIVALPFAWACSFYQNVCVLDDPEPKGLMQLGKAAMKQSLLWPGQNHLFLTIISAFGIIVFANLGIALIMLPGLIKSLLGIETVFTLSVWSMLNTTFLAVLFVLCYLCVDPIVKAGYVLRCFHGLSIRTGDDIRASLKPFISKVLPMLLLMVFAAAPSVKAQDSANQDVRPWAVQEDADSYAQRLDQAIDQVLQERRFAWRLPREKVEEVEEEPGWLAATLNWVKDALKAVGKTLYRWIKAFLKWLENLFPKPKPSDKGSGWDWRGMHRVVFYLLGFVFILLLVFLLYRWWKNRKPKAVAKAQQPVSYSVDVADETVTADDLPTDRWLLLAAELMEKKNFRRALRALYLSVLSVLAESGRVGIARHKSNLDYYRELAWRAHAEPEILQLFRDCMLAFERAWYGMHPVSRDQLDLFINDQKRISGLAR